MGENSRNNTEGNNQVTEKKVMVNNRFMEAVGRKISSIGRKEVTEEEAERIKKMQAEEEKIRESEKEIKKLKDEGKSKGVTVLKILAGVGTVVATGVGAVKIIGEVMANKNNNSSSDDVDYIDVEYTEVDSSDVESETTYSEE